MLQIRFLRKCLNMKFIYYGLMILSVSLNFETLLFGDDVSPPAWRGKQRTTYQVWDFAASGPAGSEGAEGPGYTTNLAPDVVTNAYGTPSLALSTGNFGSGWYDNSDASWSFLWGDKQGLWDIGDGSMTVVVPNLSSTNAQLVQLQITYAANFYKPPAISISPSAVLVGPPVTNLVETVPSGGEAWYTTVYTWRITPSPNQETISIVGGSTYGSIIDQIILDTQVTNPPP